MRLLALALSLLAPAALAQTPGQTYLCNGPKPCQVVDSAHPLPVQGGYDSGPVLAQGATPANASHTAGQSVGGLFTFAVARTNGGAGALTEWHIKWNDGNATGNSAVLRIWQKNPTGSGSFACNDNAAYVGDATADQNLVTPPIAVTALAPSVTTGDATVYASSSGFYLSYKNADSSPSQNLYACLVTGTTYTPTATKNDIWIGGPQD